MAAPWREGEHCIFGDTARAVGSLAYAVKATKDHYLARYRFSLAYRATCYLLPLA